MLKPRIQLAIASALLLSLCAAFAAAAPRQEANEWIVVAPAAEGFSVSLPIKPEEQTDRVPMMGSNYKTRLYTAADDPNKILYMVIMQEFPKFEGLTSAAKLEKFTDGFKEGLNKSVGTGGSKVDLLLDRSLDLKGNAGRQYTLGISDSRGVVRVFDGGLRMYVLLVIGADEKNSSVVRFFDSFEIKPAPAPVAEPITEPKP